jgi:hypothetical protein
MFFPAEFHALSLLKSEGCIQKLWEISHKPEEKQMRPFHCFGNGLTRKN